MRRDTNARNLFEVDPPSGSVLSRGSRGWCWREGKGEGERVVGLICILILIGNLKTKGSNVN